MNQFKSLKRQLAAPAASQMIVERVAKAELTGQARMQRYVVMPRRMRARSEATRRVLLGMYGKVSATYELGAKSLAAKVIDSVHEDGPKLAEMSQQAAKKLLAEAPGLL